MKNTDKALTLLNVQEVAAILRCTPANVYKLIQSGELVYVRIGKLKGYRIKPEDLEAFIDQRRTQEQPPRRNAQRSRLRHIRL